MDKSGRTIESSVTLVKGKFKTGENIEIFSKIKKLEMAEVGQVMSYEIINYVLLTVSFVGAAALGVMVYMGLAT